MHIPTKHLKIKRSFHTFYEKAGNHSIVENAKETVNNFIKSVEEIEKEFLDLLLPDSLPPNVFPTFYEENY
ncbi:MAG: hypothetical protein H0V30_16055 [Chitinophagaceae bacterium]|jgi:hypothetical protein|nr:hypothetical protein [Chitinophagaceae bacterium]